MKRNVWRTSAAYEQGLYRLIAKNPCVRMGFYAIQVYLLRLTAAHAQASPARTAADTIGRFVAFV